MSSVRAWRLCRAKYSAEDAFSGEGARLFGGRWTMPGIAVVYCAESRSLAALEVLAHIENASDLGLIEWTHWSVDIPEECVEPAKRLPASWRNYPHPPETQRIGSLWFREARSAVLRVPSAITVGEFNYLINPSHPDFRKLTISAPETFHFDPRLA